MIKESKLIGTQVPMPYGWREFKVGDLFKKKTIVGVPKVDENLIENANGFHIYGQNIKYQYNQKILLDKKYLIRVESGKPLIAYTSSTGQIGIINESFYRTGDNGAFQGLFFLGDQWSLQVAKFIYSILRKTFNIFSYSTSVSDVPDLVISLPVTAQGTPDYAFMETYIRELENQRIRELDTYLQVTGLDDTTLTDNELQVLEQWRQHEKFGGGTLLTKRFKVGELFDVLLSAGDNKISDLPNGEIPLITSGASNNGIAGLVAFGEGQLFDKGVLTADMFGNVLFQPKAFYAVSHGRVNILKPVDDGATMQSLLFIASLIKKQTVGRYGFDYMLSSSRVHDLSIELPVTVDDTLDYEFMETFIRAQEKLVMQRLDEFRQLQIDTTKAVI